MSQRPIALALLLAALLALGACGAQIERASSGNSLSESHTVTTKGTGGR